MSLTLQFVTTDREDLFDVGGRLIKAIEPKRLANKNKPVTISVRGSLAGGKKIFPDAGRAALLGPMAAFRGKAEYDEFWTGKAGDREVEIDFINIAWGSGYSTPYAMGGIGSYESRIFRDFSQQRQTGGVTYVHNFDAFASVADIDICLSQGGGFHVDSAVAREMNKTNSALQSAFRAAVSNEPWARFLKIKARSALARTAPFTDFVETTRASFSHCLVSRSLLG